MKPELTKKDLIFFACVAIGVVMYYAIVIGIQYYVTEHILK